LTTADQIAPADDQQERHRSRRWLVSAGAVVALWGAFALWTAFDIEQPTAYRPLGPRVFPVVVSTAMILLGVLLIVETLRGADHLVEDHVTEERRSSDHKQAAFVVVLLIVYSWLFERIGYILATVLFLPAAARVLGSRRPLRDVIVAVVIAGAAFKLFTDLLSIDLPEGWFALP
jgi:putative tricarboxylic transport membrane protein